MSHPEIEIKVALLRAGTNQMEIARKLGITKQFVNQVIKGHRPTRRVREAIARAVGKPVEKLWPNSNHNRKAA